MSMNQKFIKDHRNKQKISGRNGTEVYWNQERNREEENNQTWWLNCKVSLQESCWTKDLVRVN